MTDPTTLELVKRSAGRWAEAREAERAAAQDLRWWIRRARTEGHSLAEIGKVLGLSRQRVDQLSR